jgi:hypothetical protein
MIDQAEESQNNIHKGKILSKGAGIVVLSPSMQVLYMNRQAQFLISDFVSTDQTTQQPNNRTDILPPLLINLAGEIFSILRSRHEMSEKGQFEIQYFVNESGKPVVIRGVGVPNGQGVEQARIVLLLTGARVNHSENHESSGGVL